MPLMGSRWVALYLPLVPLSSVFIGDPGQFEETTHTLDRAHAFNRCTGLSLAAGLLSGPALLLSTHQEVSSPQLCLLPQLIDSPSP